MGINIPLVGYGYISYDPNRESFRDRWKSGGEYFIRIGKFEVVFTPKKWRSTK